MYQEIADTERTAKWYTFASDMFSIPITDEQRAYAWGWVKRRSVAKRGEFDGDTEHQYGGLLGEVVFADLFGFERPNSLKPFDGGVDFDVLGCKLDIKTAIRNSDPKNRYNSYLPASQMKYDNDAYLFCSINKQTKNLIVVGGIDKERMKCQITHKAGTTNGDFVFKTDTVCIPNYKLDPFTSKQDIVRFCHWVVLERRM